MATPLETLAPLLADPHPLKWVFAGDSITHGALHTMGWRDYVELFGERLRWEMRRTRDCVIKTGVSGWTAQTLLADVQWSLLQHRPDVASIAVGMNDCAAGEAGLPAFERGLRDLVAAIRRELPQAIVLLHTPIAIPPYDARREPFLPAYAKVIVEVADAVDAVLVDHRAAWLPAVADGRANYWLSDPCHPNECGHRVMARTLLEAVGAWDAASHVGRLFVP